MAARKAVSRKALLISLYRMRARGNLEGTLDHFASNIVWTVYAQPSQSRFGGAKRGLSAVRRYFGVLDEVLEVKKFRLKDACESGNVIWTRTEAVFVDRKSGKSLSLELAERWSFRGNKIATVDEYYDTAGALAKVKRSLF